MVLAYCGNKIQSLTLELALLIYNASLNQYPLKNNLLHVPQHKYYRTMQPVKSVKISLFQMMRKLYVFSQPVMMDKS